jgi:hypothetical protein
MAYEALVILGLLALLTFICRLWPILLLIILGIFIAVLRLLFLSARTVEIIEPLPLLPAPKPEPTEKDVCALAYSVIQRKITELVASEYPDARWVWQTPDARGAIEKTQPVYILLNRAGGYRRAQVVVQDLRIVRLDYSTAPAEPAESEYESDETAGTESGTEETLPQNYELLAFEWMEAHVVSLNERCNEAIAQGKTELMIFADELPDAESWPDICRELGRAGLEETERLKIGIKINLTQ